MGEGRLKNRVVFTTSIEIKLAEMLAQLSEETRIPKSKLVDEALMLLAKKHGKDT